MKTIGFLALLFGALLQPAKAQTPSELPDGKPTTEITWPNRGVSEIRPSEQSGVGSALEPNLLNQAPNPLYGIRSNIPDYAPESIAFSNRGIYLGPKDHKPADEIYIYHQPLIQIKVRIIEVVREDNLVTKTVIDYLQQRAGNSNIDAHKITGAGRGNATATRFPNDRLLNVPSLDSGAGAIVNVSTEHLNLIGELLATQFKSDLITCPQVVTLNGQRVQLLSGANVPFKLAQSVYHDGTIAVQDTFYKHLGTSLIVTPRIIDWGPHGEGVGKRPFLAKEVRDWNALADMMDTQNMIAEEDKYIFKKYEGTARLMSRNDQQLLLDYLNARDRDEVVHFLQSKNQVDDIFKPLLCDCDPESGCPCNWNPANCTLDIQIVLRQSQAGESPTISLASDKIHTEMLTKEEVGAAIADVVQLKNGHGAVIGGLIGDRDIQIASKVPLLGDIPWVGAAFRQKSTDRQKTEIVILLEAQILPSEPYDSIAKSAEDFVFTSGYLNRDVLCNPMDAAMQRTGVGGCLPPKSCNEKIYWERLGRNVQQACTSVQDTLR